MTDKKTVYALLSVGCCAYIFVIIYLGDNFFLDVISCWIFTLAPFQYYRKLYRNVLWYL